MIRSEEYRGVRPAYLALYLERTGWTRLPKDYFGAQQWIHSKTGIDILAPLDQGSRDYSRFVAELIAGVARVEDREPLDVFRDLQLAGADTVRISRPTEPDQAGIPLESARTVVESAMRMMAAAAAAAVERRSVLPPRRPRQAIEYMERRLQLGHTQRGSYVLTLISDVTPLLTPGGIPGLLEYMEAPFPRLVTRTLSTALIEARPAAVSLVEGDMAALQPAVEQGVTADLFDSLAGLLAGAKGTDGLAVSLRWASAYPEITVEPVSQTFETREGFVFAEAARRIRQIEPLEGIPVTGVIEGLHRAEGQEDGEVVVSCIIDHSPRNLHVPLGPDDYDLAIAAHRDKRVVVFRADVDRRGRRYVAADVRGFRTTDD